MTGLTPYDLAPPGRLLYPQFLCHDQPRDSVTVILDAGFGDEDDPARVVREDRGSCPAGCCKPSTTLWLRVPCDSLPHCGSCECGSEHEFLLTNEQVTELKGILP